LILYLPEVPMIKGLITNQGKIRMVICGQRFG